MLLIYHNITATILFILLLIRRPNIDINNICKGIIKKRWIWNFKNMTSKLKCWWKLANSLECVEQEKDISKCLKAEISNVICVKKNRHITAKQDSIIKSTTANLGSWILQFNGWDSMIKKKENKMMKLF